jgi:predicted AlkP superfamily pyrophosphatase or phosphodiesterase
MDGASLCLISIDGLRASTLSDVTIPLPALRGLAERGVRADGLTPSFPSVTWPCHATLVTGVQPARHGILGNHVLDRLANRIVSHYGDRSGARPRAETIYDAAAAAGLGTAAVCWPQTRGAACLDDNVPEFYEQALFEAHASRPLWDELHAAGLPIDRYAEWSTEYRLTPLQDWLTLEVALHLLRRRPPDVLLVHFLSVDSFQHDFGLDTPETHGVLRYVDSLVAKLLAALESAGRLASTNVVIVGDHGFTPVQHMALPNLALHADGLLRLSARGDISGASVRVVGNGGSAHVYVSQGRRRAALIDQVRERFTFAPGVAMVLAADAFPDLGLPSPNEDLAQGDLMLVAADGWYFADHATLEAANAARPYRGMHGQLPNDPRLRAGLVAAGPGIVSGVSLGVLHHLDVAPTLADLLHVKLGAAERAPVEAMLIR